MAHRIVWACLLALTMTVAARAEALKVAVSQRGFWDSSFVDFALREGFFKQENLEIEVFYTEGGAGTLDAVMSGSVDIGMSNGILGVIGRYVKNAPIRVVSAEMTGASDAYWYARADSGIASLNDAEGKTIAFSSPGSSSNLMVLALLKKAQKNAKAIATGGAPATFTQVMTKQIDIGWAVPPTGLADIEQGRIRMVARGSDVPAFASQTLRVNVTRADRLESKRDALTRFMRVYAKTIDWAYADPKSLVYFAEENGISAETAKATLAFFPKDVLQTSDIKGLDQTLRDALEFKYISERKDPADVRGLFDILPVR